MMVEQSSEAPKLTPRSMSISNKINLALSESASNLHQFNGSKRGRVPADLATKVSPRTSSVLREKPGREGPEYTHITSRKPLLMSRASVNSALLGDPTLVNRPSIPTAANSQSSNLRRSKSASYSAAAWRAYGSPSARGQFRTPAPSDPVHPNPKTSVIDSLRGSNVTVGMLGGGFVMPRPQTAPSQRPAPPAPKHQSYRALSPSRPKSPILGEPPKGHPQPDLRIGLASALPPPLVATPPASPSSTIKRATHAYAHQPEPHTLDILAQRDHVGEIHFTPSIPTDPRTKEVWAEIMRKKQIMAGTAQKVRPSASRSGRFSSMSITHMQQMGASFQPYKVSGFGQSVVEVDRPDPEDPSWALSRVGQGTLDRLHKSIQQQGAMLRPYSAPVPSQRPSFTSDGNSMVHTPAYRAPASAPTHRAPPLAAVPEEDLYRLTPVPDDEAISPVGVAVRPTIPTLQLEQLAAGAPTSPSYTSDGGGNASGSEPQQQPSPSTAAPEAGPCDAAAEPSLSDSLVAAAASPDHAPVDVVVNDAPVAVGTGLDEYEGYVQDDDGGSGDDDEIEAVIQRVAQSQTTKHNAASSRPTSAAELSTVLDVSELEAMAKGSPTALPAPSQSEPTSSRGEGGAESSSGGDGAGALGVRSVAGEEAEALDEEVRGLLSNAEASDTGAASAAEGSGSVSAKSTAAPQTDNDALGYLHGPPKIKSSRRGEHMALDPSRETSSENVAPASSCCDPQPGAETHAQCLEPDSQEEHVGSSPCTEARPQSAAGAAPGGVGAQDAAPSGVGTASDHGQVEAGDGSGGGDGGESGDLGIQADAGDEAEEDSFGAFGESVGLPLRQVGSAGRPTSGRPAAARPTSARPTSARPASGSGPRPVSGGVLERFGETAVPLGMEVILEAEDAHADMAESPSVDA